jgi:hypothetical protein
MIEAAPQPILGTFDQPAMNRVAVDVAEFLDSLRLTPDVEIIVTRLPERYAFDGAEFAGGVLLEHLDHDRELTSLRFAH